MFEEDKFVELLLKCKDSFDKIISTKNRSALIDEIVTAINEKTGTADKIKSEIDNGVFSQLKNDDQYSRICDLLNSDGFADDSLDEFLVIYQIIKIWNAQTKKDINHFLEHCEYEKEKEEFDKCLNLLSPEWKGIRTVKRKNSLVVEYPLVNELSNGQRDVLTFVTELIKFKIKIESGKKYFLLIDEVFDYLDDANTIAAQYYLSNLLNDDLNAEIYVCMLTHLDPKYFRSYIFSPKKLNIQYLSKGLPVSGIAMKTFIAYRESLDDKTSPDSIYNKLSKFLFHYNPNVVDLSSELSCSRTGFRKTFGKTEVLKEYLIGELNKYLSESEPYDPYAVALGLRHKVEKLCYEKLGISLRSNFIETHKTIDKFDFCIDNNVNVPGVFYVVSAIHNEADHLKFDPNNPNEFLEKSMVYKLQNNVIKQALKKLFGYNGEPISVDSIM